MKQGLLQQMKRGVATLLIAVMMVMSLPAEQSFAGRRDWPTVNVKKGETVFKVYTNKQNRMPYAYSAEIRLSDRSLGRTDSRGELHTKLLRVQDNGIVGWEKFDVIYIDWNGKTYIFKDRSLGPHINEFYLSDGEAITAEEALERKWGNASVISSYQGKTTDLRQTSKTFSAYKEKPGRKAEEDRIDTLKIDVSSGKEYTTGARFYLMQGGKLVVESAEPKFEIPVYDLSHGENPNFREPALKGFKAGEAVYFVVMDKQGNRSSSRIGLNIVADKKNAAGSTKLSAQLTQKAVTLKLNGVPLLGDNVEMNLMPAGMNTPFLFYIDQDKLRIGINLKREFMEGEKKPDGTTGEHKATAVGGNKAFFEAVNDAKKGKFEKLDRMSASRFKATGYASAKFDASLNFVGYGEVETSKIMENTGTVSLAIHGLIYGKVEGRVVAQAVIAFVPVYGYAGATGTLGAEGDLRAAFILTGDGYKFSDWSWDVDVLASVGLEAGLGVGIHGVLSAGLGGNIGVDGLYRFKNTYYKATAKGGFFAEVYLSPIIKVKKNWPLLDKVIADGYINSQSGNAMMLQMMSEEDAAFRVSSIDQFELETLPGDEPVLLAVSDGTQASLTDNTNDFIISGDALQSNTVELIQTDKGDYAFWFGTGDGSYDSAGVMYAKLATGSDAETASASLSGAGETKASPSNAPKASLSDAGAKKASSSNAEETATPSDASSDGEELVNDLSANASRSTRNASVYGLARSAAPGFEGEPKRIAAVLPGTDVETMDLYYDVKASGNKLYVAVSKSKDRLEGDTPENDAIREILSSSEIYLFTIDAESGEVEDTQQLSVDSNFDGAPSVYVDEDGTVYVAWIETETSDGDIFGENANYNLYLYRGAGAPERLSLGRSFPTSNLEIGKFNGTVSVIYSAKPGIGDGEEKNELYSYDGVNNTRLTDNNVNDTSPQIYMTATGSNLVWYQEGALMETASPGEAGTEIVSASENPMEGFTILQNKDKTQTMIVWEGMDPDYGEGRPKDEDWKKAYYENARVSIQAVEKRDSGWSKHFIIYDETDYLISHVSGYLNEDGYPVLLHTNTGMEIIDENEENNNSARSELILTTRSLYSELAIENVYYDYVYEQEGDTTGKMSFQLTFRNNGIEPIDSAEIVAFSNEFMGEATGSWRVQDFMEVDLQPGESRVVTLICDVGDISDKDRDITFRVAPADRIADSTDAVALFAGEAEEEEVEAYNLNLHRDMLVETELGLMDGEDCVRVMVTNVSDLPMGGRLELRKDSKDGMLLDTVELEPIYPDVTRYISVGINELLGGRKAERIVAVLTYADGVVDYVQTNNVSEINISMLPRQLNPYRISGSSQNAVSELWTRASVLTGGTWEQTAAGWRLMISSGSYAEGQWALVNGKWYLFDERGYMVSGWKKANGMWYYLDPVNGDMKSGWQLINDKWYYFDAVNGDMKSGWQLINDKWYYLDAVNGDMKSGWQLINEKWYYLDAINGDMKTGLQYLDGKEYYFDPVSGEMHEENRQRKTV